MPKFKVGGSYGFAGTDWQDIWEGDSQEEVEKEVFDYMAERLSFYVEPIEEEKNETDS